MRSSKAEELGVTPIISLVVWVGFVAVGVLGKNQLLEKSTDAAPKKPGDVHLIDVAISNLPIERAAVSAAPASPVAPQPDLPAVPEPPEAPPAAPAPEMPAMPPLLDAPPPPPMVSFEPKPNEFSKSTSQPAAVTINKAVLTPARSNTSAPPAPGVQHLVYGQGVAVQPEPEYPPECAMAHQEGTVVIRFHVDDQGRVGDVQVETPSRWPLLNQAAARSVRQSWIFAPGTPGDFDVSITYQLTPP